MINEQKIIQIAGETLFNLASAACDLKDELPHAADLTETQLLDLLYKEFQYHRLQQKLKNEPDA